MTAALWPDGRRRCSWVTAGDDVYAAYHDDEWGRPVRDDRALFEQLILEGAQAGLSWRTVLHKRDSYRAAYASFDVEQVAAFGPDDVQRLLADPGIVRNRQKVAASIDNARAFLALAAEEGSFAEWLWGFVDGEPHRTRPRFLADVPASSALAEQVSRELKRRGFRFVGPTTVHAFLQAVGVLDEHMEGCFRAASG